MLYMSVIQQYNTVFKESSLSPSDAAVEGMQTQPTACEIVINVDIIH